MNKFDNIFYNLELDDVFCDQSFTNVRAVVIFLRNQMTETGSHISNFTYRVDDQMCLIIQFLYRVFYQKNIFRTVRQYLFLHFLADTYGYYFYNNKNLHQAMIQMKPSCGYNSDVNGNMVLHRLCMGHPQTYNISPDDTSSCSSSCSFSVDTDSDWNSDDDFSVDISYSGSSTSTLSYSTLDSDSYSEMSLLDNDSDSELSSDSSTNSLDAFEDYFGIN